MPFHKLATTVDETINSPKERISMLAKSTQKYIRLCQMNDWKRERTKTALLHLRNSEGENPNMSMGTNSTLQRALTCQREKERKLIRSYVT